MSTNLQVLRGAIENKREATVTLGGRRADDRLQVRMLRCEDRLHEEGIWVELLDGEAGRIERLIKSQTLLLVSFNEGPLRVFFETLVLAQKKQLRRKRQLLLAWPLRVRVSERRGGDREPVPTAADIEATLQLGAGEAPMPLQVLDLSPTGAGLLCPPGKRPPHFQPGQPLHVFVRLRDGQHRVTMVHRHTQTLPNGRVRIGVEFEAKEGEEPQIPAPLRRLMDSLQNCRISSTIGSAIAGKGAA